jgi:hypothetical protein
MKAIWRRTLRMCVNIDDGKSWKEKFTVRGETSRKPFQFTRRRELMAEKVSSVSNEKGKRRDGATGGFGDEKAVKSLKRWKFSTRIKGGCGCGSHESLQPHKSYKTVRVQRFSGFRNVDWISSAVEIRRLHPEWSTTLWESSLFSQHHIKILHIFIDKSRADGW